MEYTEEEKMSWDSWWESQIAQLRETRMEEIYGPTEGLW